MADDLNTILDSFKEELLRQQKSKNTVRAYLRDVEEFIHWFSTCWVTLTLTQPLYILNPSLQDLEEAVETLETL